MTTLFGCLSPSNIVLFFAALTTEQPIVLISKHWSSLMDVAETMCSFMFPFVYQGVYMPVLPEDLLDFVSFSIIIIIIIFW